MHRRMAATAGVAMVIQSAMRAGNGSATAPITTPQTRISQPTTIVAARREGRSSIRSIRAPQGAIDTDAEESLHGQPLDRMLAREPVQVVRLLLRRFFGGVNRATIPS